MCSGKVYYDLYDDREKRGINDIYILRRQLHREIRKPLILMTPKSLLRHKRAVSRLDELGADATFHRILYDDAQMLPDEKIKLVADDKIRRVVLCSGKVYYDLYDEREKRGIDDIYIMPVMMVAEASTMPIWKAADADQHHVGFERLRGAAQGRVRGPRPIHRSAGSDRRQGRRADHRDRA